MRTILGWMRQPYVAKVSIFLITVALIAGMAGCGEATRYNFTMAANPAGGGITTDLTNASPYTASTVVSIKAVANLGYGFVNWTAPAGIFGNANAADTTFTMPAQNVTVTANFAPLGSGTEEDPYQIANWHQLHNLRNYLDSYFILVTNLDSTTAGYTELASPTANEGKGWQPIGSFDTDLQKFVDPFTGTFDGQGYEIRDLFIDRPDKQDGVGLFGAVDVGGVVKNVGMVDANVTGELHVGSLVGVNNYTISDCYSTGNVTGDTNVGGLVGVNVEGDVSNSYATVTVTGGVGGSGAGGLVGANLGTVDDSYSTGSVTGDLGVGGLVGYSFGTVSNSYSTGNVTGFSEVGGLVGSNEGTVDSSYSTGSITGDDAVGGLVGDNENTVSNSFWDTATSGQFTSDGGTGKTTAEMQDIATFTGATWDIVAVANPSTRNPSYIWNIVDDETYPFLSWQPV